MSIRDSALSDPINDLSDPLVKPKDAEITTLKGQVAQHVSEIETLKERVTHLVGWVQTQCGINDRKALLQSMLRLHLSRIPLLQAMPVAADYLGRYCYRASPNTTRQRTRRYRGRSGTLHVLRDP